MNSAQRIAAIYRDLCQAQSNDPMVKVWAQIFGVAYVLPEAEDSVSACLVTLRKEINALRTRLNNLDVPNSLLDPGFEQLHNACSGIYLQQPLSGLKNSFGAAECKYPFIFAEWVLRSEVDKDVAPEAIDKIRAQLHELREEARAANIPHELREFLLHQIAVLERAVVEYRIVGSKAFDVAYKTVVVEVNTASDEIKNAAVKTEEAAPGLVTKFVDAFKTVGAMGDAAKKIHDALPAVAEWVQALLPPP